MTTSQLQDKSETYHGQISKQSTGAKRCYGSFPCHEKEQYPPGPVSKVSNGKKPSYDSFPGDTEEPSSLGPVPKSKKSIGKKPYYTSYTRQEGPSSRDLTSKKSASNKRCDDSFPRNMEEQPPALSKRGVREPFSSPRTSPASSDSESENLGDCKKNVRGVARGEALERHVKKNGKFKILFLPGRTISVTNNKDFSSAIGLIVRNHADIERASGWKFVSNKRFCYARLLHWFDIEDLKTTRVQHIVDKKFQKAYSCWKNTLHTAYDSLKDRGIRPRSISPRVDVSLAKWQMACDFIEREDYQARSNINKENRKKKLFNHTSGRTPLISRYEEMEEKSEIELFKVAYVSSKRGGEFVNSVAESKYDEMVEQRKDLEEAGYVNIDESHIVLNTLGHKSGYVKGMGHGLELVRGNTSNMVAGINLKEKLSELDVANEKIENLSNLCDDQKKSMDSMKLSMSKMQKIIEKLPGIPPDLFLDENMDDIS